MGNLGDYRIVGGHMVRLLLHVYPTQGAVARSTLDADAAVDDVQFIGPITSHLIGDNFIKTGGNVLIKKLADEQKIEINLLLSRTGPKPGLQLQTVDGVGQVDSLPELSFAMMCAPVVLDVEARLGDFGDQEVLKYRTRIPDVEAATVLKAHSWRDRHSEKDLADLLTLLEIRESHPNVPWRLNEKPLMGFRKDTAQTLRELAKRVNKKSFGYPVPGHLNRTRFAALIGKHIAGS